MRSSFIRRLNVSYRPMFEVLQAEHLQTVFVRALTFYRVDFRADPFASALLGFARIQALELDRCELPSSYLSGQLLSALAEKGMN